MMVTEKQQQIREQLIKMEECMRTKGYLPIIDAHDFLLMGTSIEANFEDMRKSRDKWRKKYEKLKEENKTTNK